VYFDIGKQKVAWIPKLREHDEKVVENALNSFQLSSFLFLSFVKT
jgi:hypothetical protein